MKKKTFMILFFIKRTKQLKNGEVPIYLRVTVDGVRAEMSIHRSLDPAQWIESRGCARATSARNKELNHFLEHIRHRMYEIQKELEDEDKIATAELLLNRYKGINENRITFVDLYTEHNKKMQELVGKEFAEATVIRHTTSLKHVVEFLQYKYGKNDIFLKDITLDLLKEYEHYLKAVKKCNNNTTVKYIRNMGKVLGLAEQKGYIKNNPIKGLKLHVKEVKKEFLSKEEIDVIMQKKFVSDRLTQVRDVFLFCCFTGLSFIDVKQLHKEDFILVDGVTVIRKQRQKTNVWYSIPLLPVAKQILAKYESKPLPNNQLLPVPSNTKMNAYLKEIADVCGITKNLTTHTARHTNSYNRMKYSALHNRFCA